ncbi:MAG: hypothetical protein K6A98_06315 [Prevotella sp.]|nr:hypothetical protein [Prevotella sp.]
MQSLIATGMPFVYPVVCLKAVYAFNAHLRVYHLYFSWVSLCLSTNVGCGKPQPAGRQVWIPTFFVLW